MANDAKRWRQLTVWLHVLSSVGWMAMALVLFVLLLRAVRAPDPVDARAAAGMADVVDVGLLAPMANVSAYTGLVLSFGTAWGLVLYRWVLAKFAITFVQLYCGIFLLHGALRSAAVTGAVSPQLLVGAAVMATAIAGQAWLSIAKPGKRTRWATDRATGRATRLPTASTWVFVAGVAAPVVDVAVGIAIARPLPVLSAGMLVVVIVARRIAPARPGRREPAPSA